MVFETHFIFMLFETNFVFILFALMLFGNSPYSTFIKLLERFIKVLAAILRLEVLQVSLRSSSNFKSK